MPTLSKMVGLYLQVSCHFNCETFHRFIYKYSTIMVARGPPKRRML